MTIQSNSTARASGVRKLLAKMQKQENDLRADRRRRLVNGVNRALLHLTDADMDELEPIIQQAIGRSIMGR